MPGGEGTAGPDRSGPLPPGEAFRAQANLRRHRRRRPRRFGPRPVEVVTPDGRTWTVRRRWVSRIGTETVGGRTRRRLRAIPRRARGPADLMDVGQLGDVPVIGWIFALVALAALAVVVLVLIVPLLLLVLELTLLALLAALTFAARSVLRRPWVVEAIDDRGGALRWRVVGGRAARDRCREVAQHLEAGITPPDAEPIAPAPAPAPTPAEDVPPAP